MEIILDQFHLLGHMFCPHIFVVTNSYCCLFKKRLKKNENIYIFFYTKEVEIGYVLIFSSVKISTYKYCKTNKTLSFVYNRLYAHCVLFFRNVFDRHKKSFLITVIELKPCHCITLKKTLEKNNIMLYNYYC